MYTTIYIVDIIPTPYYFLLYTLGLFACCIRLDILFREYMSTFPICKASILLRYSYSVSGVVTYKALMNIFRFKD